MTKFVLVTLLFAAYMALTDIHNLVGSWRSRGAGKSKVILEFKTDGKFKVSVDGRTENEGHYQFAKDTFTMYDGNCGLSVPGRYKINFYTPDSASFSLLADSCKDRAGEVNGGVIVRAK